MTIACCKVPFSIWIEIKWMQCCQRCCTCNRFINTFINLRYITFDIFDIICIFVNICCVICNLISNIISKRYFVIVSITIYSWCYLNVVTSCYSCNTRRCCDLILYAFKLRYVNRISICYASFHIIDFLIACTNTVCSVVNSCIPFTSIHTVFIKFCLF